MTLPQIKIRCSKLGSIMTEPKAKGQLLSAGAKTYVENLAKGFVYGFSTSVCTKEMQKGLIVESDAIALLSELDCTTYMKNMNRLENEWLTGTPDILTPTHVKDIKSSWTLATFPATPADAYDKDYDWQLRGYMMLSKLDQAELCFVMIDTPDELIPSYEDESLHRVSHIDPAMRVTRFPFFRDGESEANIIRKVGYCREHFAKAVDKILSSHQ